ncbi:hypothetical protein [Dyella amyloliquefaciens]|uniref:hypothetical protein n=1 Tax=Dyella amyloliquefaciens TaxID=1770545 RepID=UPI00102E96DB|nr:hypothetical protein [Dyella amyloliquefaciens]
MAPDVPSGEPAVVAQDIHIDPLGPFSPKEMRTFMASVERADAIPDSMQRCLHYPDPPGSHWSPQAIEAYCRYRLQPVVDTDQLIALAGAGRAKEIDREVRALMQGDARLKPQEIAWRTIARDCYDPSPQLRIALDQWKSQVPESALAYATSGYCYVISAWRARGAREIEDTPAEKMRAMGVLLDKAKVDLDKAAKLDPKLVTTYAAMINAGLLASDKDYMVQALQHGMAEDRASLPLYDMLAYVTQPRWYGSQQMQRQLMASAMNEAARNPLLLTIRGSVLADVYDLRHCYCTTRDERLTVRDAFDQVTSTGILINVADNAMANHYPDIAYVYYSETIRFYPKDEADDALKGRAAALSALWIGGAEPTD